MLKYLKKLIPGMAIGSRTSKGIDAINETQVLGFFESVKFYRLLSNFIFLHLKFNFDKNSF